MSQPRSWKYENDEQNRRVKREGSIERREEVAERELSPTDVRQKLQKKTLPVLQPRPRQAEARRLSDAVRDEEEEEEGGEEGVDVSELPPSPTDSPPPPPPSISRTARLAAAAAVLKAQKQTGGTDNDGEKSSVSHETDPSHSLVSVSGDHVSGDRVSGDRVSGDRESGDRVSGDREGADRVREALQALTSRQRREEEEGEKSLRKDSKQSLHTEIEYPYVTWKYMCIAH